jgi:hypothetical protein
VGQLCYPVLAGQTSGPIVGRPETLILDADRLDVESLVLRVPEFEAQQFLVRAQC